MGYESNEFLFFAGRAAILVVALIAFAVAFGRWRRAGARDMQHLVSVTEGLVAKLATLEEKLDTRAQLSAAAAGNAPRGYDLALRLARNGAEAGEIAETSGVTRQEADLLARLHGPETVRLRTGT
ncbi:MAG: DUF2802 domain-containing protein [Pseudomonadota bacterium]